MSLDTSGLTSDLDALFANPPCVLVGDLVDVAASRAACAAAWASTMQHYAVAVVPVSSTVVAAAAALDGALASAFASDASWAELAADVDSAFVAFAAAVGTGMLPAYIATPPVGAPGFFAGIGASLPTHADAASYWSGKIDLWMRTGTAVPPLGGPSVLWL